MTDCADIDNCFMEWTNIKSSLTKVAEKGDAVPRITAKFNDCIEGYLALGDSLSKVQKKG